MLKTKYLIAASPEIRLVLLRAINEYKLNDESSIPKKRAIRLLEDIIIKQPIRAKIRSE